MTIINDQWELTDDGLRGCGALSYYEIAASRLTESGDFADEIYDWPQHMAQKDMLDYGLFVEAYKKALNHFAGAYQPPLDGRKLEESITVGQSFVDTH